MFADAPPNCPRCGGADAVRPIAYGYPSPDMQAAADRGEVILGGCMPGEATHTCRACRRCFVQVDAAEDDNDDAPPD